MLVDGRRILSVDQEARKVDTRVTGEESRRGDETVARVRAA